MKISVILLVYNRPDLMVKTLLSLNSQSMPPSEVVVTDDGSDKDMLSEIKLINPELNYKVKYVRQENNGCLSGTPY